MTIGYYLTNVKPSDGGIFQYSIYILKMLINCNTVTTIYLFYSQEQLVYYKPFFENRKVKPVLEKSKGKISRVFEHFSDFWLTRYYIRLKQSIFCLRFYRILNPERRFLNKYNLDLLHIPRQHSPAYDLKYPVVVTMHDIQHFHFPEFFTPLERIHKAIRYHITMQEADHIIVSYNHVKQDLIKYFKSSEKKISVCPVPLNEDWIIDEATPPQVLKDKYHLPDTFILTPAATWEHKNHVAILEALNILRGESYNIFWVATGHLTPYYKTIKSKIEELKLNNHVLFTGIVPEADLKGLYRMTSLVVIPTLYEAGSGPLFESMRYKVPVVCSNVTSLPETIGDQEFVFNPLNYLEIATLIKLGLTDKEFVLRNIKNSIKRVSELCSSENQKTFIEAYSLSIGEYKQNQLN